MNKVIIIGSLNIDLFMHVKQLPTIGETILGSNTQYMTGGKGANQAIAAARFGADVTMLGKVGDDQFGQQLISSLKSNNIHINHLEVAENSASGLATIIKLPQDNSIIVSPGANQLTDIDYINEHVDVIKNCDVLLAQLEIPIETVEHACKIAKKYNVKTVLNPAPFSDQIIDFIDDIDIITPNETEFKALMKSDPDFSQYETIEDSMIAWKNKFPNTELIVTRGDKGSSFIQDGKVVTIPGKKVNVIDTTGAGDTFNGILSTELSNDSDLHTAITRANVGAALSVQKLGAQSGMPTYSEMIAQL